MMKSLVQFSFLLLISISLVQCADRKVDAKEAVIELKIDEAYIQEEIPGQEGETSKWIFTAQVDPTIILETVILGDETYKLTKSGKTWKAVLIGKYTSESEIPTKRFLTFISDSKTAKAPIPKIVLKEALYMP